VGPRVGLGAWRRETSLVFADNLNENFSAVQPIEYAHYAILASNLSDITPKFYVFAIFLIIGLKAIFLIHRIDAVMFHYSMKYRLSLSNGSLDIVINYEI
jgi:hypothetical protein